MNSNSPSSTFCFLFACLGGEVLALLMMFVCLFVCLFVVLIEIMSFGASSEMLHASRFSIS